MNRKRSSVLITNVLDFLDVAVAAYPQKIALADTDSRYSYTEYRQIAQAIACHINQVAGGMTRRPIAVSIGRDARSAILFMAVVYSGNCYVPIDFAQPEERIQKILDTTQPLLILSHGDDASAFSNDKIKEPVLNINFEELLPIDERLLANIRQQTIDTDPLYIMFTSGSTGIPKGIVVSHRSVIDLVTRFSEVFNFSADTVFGNQAPFDFDVSVKDIYNALFCGGSVQIIPKSFSLPLKLFEYLDEHRIILLFGRPRPCALLKILKHWTVRNRSIFESDVFRRNYAQ